MRDALLLLISCFVCYPGVLGRPATETTYAVPQQARVAVRPEIPAVAAGAVDPCADSRSHSTADDDVALPVQ